MSSLLRSIEEIWMNSSELTALIPFAKVFTGRVPSTREYRFPYVSIISTGGGTKGRSDKARYSTGTVSFHIWVDDTQLEYGLTVADSIANVYADKNWTLSSTAKVTDMIDEGEPISHQTNLPNIKAWEIVKLFSVRIERSRVDHTQDTEVSDDSLSG